MDHRIQFLLSIDTQLDAELCVAADKEIALRLDLLHRLYGNGQPHAMKNVKEAG
jgi:hypothetical protein